MIKFIHAADFHLDSPFAGLSGEKSALRRRELREIPARLAQLVREQGADLLLLPGDLFDGERVCPETVEALQSALGGLSIPVFIAPGNHDYFHSRSPYAAPWPENVHIFTDAALCGVEVESLNCVVHGCAFTDPHRTDDPLSGFAAPEDGRIHLLCVHGEVAQTGAYAPISPASLAACGAEYAALGHIHARSPIQRTGKTCWAYPGCPEGRGFDECGEKGAYLVSVDNGRVTGEFLPVGQRQYLIRPLELTGDPAGALPGEVSPHLVRILLRGEQARPLDLVRLERLWKERFFHLELRDETTLPRDLWARAGEDTLTGLFLRRMKERLDRADEADIPKLLLAVRFGLTALEGGEDVRP